MEDKHCNKIKKKKDGRVPSFLMFL